MKELSRTATVWFAWFLALWGVAVTALAAAGFFQSMDSFPLIFAFAVLGLAIVTWLVAGRGLNCRVMAPLGLAVVLAFGSHLVHEWAGEERISGMEEQALAKLDGTSAAELAFVAAFQEGLAIDGIAQTAEHSFAGKMSVVNFWATWCGPCREELPMLERFYEDHKSEAVQILGVTRVWGQIPDDSTLSAGISQIEEFVAQYGITYPVYVDSTEQNFKAFLVKQIPTTILIDSSGRVVDYAIGVEGAKRILGRVEKGLR